MTRAELEELARAVAPLVALELARMLSTRVEPSGFSTRKGCGPEGYSSYAWNDLARRIGTKRGRWWFVSREQLAAHEGVKALPVSPPTPSGPVPWHPSQAAASLGLRPLPKGGR